MKSIAGAILIHAAAVVFAAQWLGRAQQSPAVVGSPDAWYVSAAAAALAVGGCGYLVAGYVFDRKP